MCFRLVIYQNYTEKHGKQHIKNVDSMFTVQIQFDN
jgi:hypothetical protein